MTDNKNIRRQIREHFNYLITDYDFVDDLGVYTNDIHSEVKFKKNDWRVSVATTAHGTKISMKLISPNDDFGFLSHYFKTLDKEYKKNENGITDLGDSLKFHSNFLRTHGLDILTADSKRLTEITGLIKVEHEKWIKPLTIRRNDE